MRRVVHVLWEERWDEAQSGPCSLGKTVGDEAQSGPVLCVKREECGAY